MSVSTPANAPSQPAVEPVESLEARLRSDRTSRLGRGFLSLYGLGAAVDSTAAVYLNTFLYFYLTAVCGLGGAMAGLALAITLVVDSVIDPLVGSVSDNSRSRFGRRHPFMLLAALPIGLSLGLLFSAPAGLHGWGLFAYATSLALCLRMGLSAFNVPYIALGAEMTDDYHARSTVVAFRVGLGVLGTLAGLVLGYGVFLSAPAGGQLHRAGYTPFAWCGGAIVATVALLSATGTLSVRRRLHSATPGEGAAVWRLSREMGEVFRNRSFLFLFAACLIFFVAQGAAGALTLHANTFFWRLSPFSILVISLSLLPGVLAGIVVAAALNRRLEKRTIALAGLMLIFVSQVSPVTLSLSGVVPRSATVPMLIVAVLIAGVGVTMALVGFQSMMADATDEHELLFSARREGLYFAGLSFAAKASSGLGVLVAGLAADAIGFPNDLAAQGAHVHVPWTTARSLALIYGPGAATITLAAVVTLFGFRLSRQAHADILETLSQRRQLTESPEAAV
jgi:GPH family glycoside/pentoside/hexuronide:cation symporter